MTTNLNREKLADGVFFTTIQDTKFRHNRLSLNFVVPMRAETVTEYALLSYLLRRATSECPDFTKLNRRLDELYGAVLSCDVSKIAANQVITFGISFIDDEYTLTKEDISEQCANLLCELVTKPLIQNGEFLKEDFDIELKNLIDSINSLINDKRSYAVAACRELMGRGEDASLQKLGTVERAQSITAKSAAQAYSRLIAQARIELLFIGAGNGVSAKKAVAKAFEQIKRTPGELASPKKFQVQEKPLEKIERLDVAQSKLVMGFRTAMSENLQEQAAARVMTALYGGTPSSKLFMNVREKLSLCYYCAARYDRSSSIVMVDSGVEKQNIEKAKSEILVQLADIAKGDFEDVTLINTKNLLKTAYMTVNDSAMAIEDWYLQRIITDTVVTPDDELKLLLGVTREEVAAAAAATKLDAVYLLTGMEE